MRGPSTCDFCGLQGPAYDVKIAIKRAFPNPMLALDACDACAFVLGMALRETCGTITHQPSGYRRLLDSFRELVRPKP